VGTTAATERVTGDIHRPVLVLGEHPDGAATEIWAIAVAPVADEPGVDRLELAALDVDGATAVDAAVPALRGVGRAGRLVRAVEPVGERDVLHDDLRIRLVDAVAGRPLARARVGEKDPALAPAAERDEAAAIEDDQVSDLGHAGGRRHQDRDRPTAAVEPGDPAGGDGPGHSRGGTTGGRGMAAYGVR